MASTVGSMAQRLTLDQSLGVVPLVERFDVPNDVQAEAVELGKEHVAELWRNEPANLGEALLRCRNRRGLPGHMQRQRRFGDEPAIAGAAPTASQTMAAVP